MISVSGLTTHLKRVRNASRFSVKFMRRATFRFPAQVTIRDREIRLSCPPEERETLAKLVFLENFIDDQYRLSRVRDSISTVADIGANIGCFSLTAGFYFPNAILHAYEPNPRVLPYLRANVEPLPARVFAEAVGAADGTIFMKDDGLSGNARTMAAPPGSAGLRQIAFSTVVDRLNGWIDLLKLDCEGAEWGLFTAEACWRRVGQICMEYHLWDNHSLGEVEEKLARLRFRIRRHEPGAKFGLVWAENMDPMG